MSIAILIIVLIICLIVEGFFSGSEMALVNADKYKIALATDAGSESALAALHMVKHPAKFFSTTLLGTNLGTVTGSVVATFFIIDRYGEAYAPLALLYWPFTLILGEIVPKSIFQHYADRIVYRVAPPLLWFSMALYPVIWLFSQLTDMLLGGVKRRAGMSPPISREELGFILEVGQAGRSDVRPSERTMISRVFDLAEKRVRGIMTPLVDVVSVPMQAGREDAARLLEKYNFSRVPVYDVRVFNIVGILSGSDLLFGDQSASLATLMSPAYFVPGEMPLDELLVTMKRRSEPMAIVVDEYGAAIGIVTTEDLIEEVVGDIRDEHDDSPSRYKRLGWHHYLASGRMEIAEANEKFKLGIPEGEYKTLAGFLIHRMERIPKMGESLGFGKFRMTVVRSTERSVLDIEILPIPGEGERR